MSRGGQRRRRQRQRVRTSRGPERKGKPAVKKLIRSIERDVPTVTYEQDDDSVVVIIGSGAGGGTLANELTRHGIDVVLLEAGPRFTMDDFVNDEWTMWERFTWKDKRDATGSSPVARDFAEAPTWVCKGYGGSTLHWAAMCPRVQPHEFQALGTYGAVEGANLADWPFTFEEIEPWYVRAEKKIGVTGRNGIPLHPGNNVYKLLALGAKRMGYRDFDPNPTAINSVPYGGRNSCDQIGFCMQGCRSGAKWSTMNSELPAAEASGRCEVRTHSMAVRIEHDDKNRVREVVYIDGAGETQRQRARLVCVAANAFETTRLLLNSESSRFPDGLANSSGQLGRNYMRHTTGYLYGVFENPVHMNRGRVTGGIVRDEAGHDDSRGFAAGYFSGSLGLGLPFLAAFMNPKGWGREYTSWIEQYAHLGGFHFNGEDLPVETNRITLHTSERDQFGLPIPTLHLDDHPNDIAMKAHANEKTRDLALAAGASRVWIAPPLPASHNMGTCRMSRDPERGVLNGFGQSHDLENLFVSDGSQFTTSMAPNPTLLIVTLAMRQAEYIRDQMAARSL